MAQPTTTSAGRPKFDWYQTEQFIVVNVLVKKIDPTAVTVTFGPREVAFKYAPEGATPVELNLNLMGFITPQESTYRVSPVKAEIKLRKVTNLRWGNLESGQTDIVDTPTAFTAMAAVTPDIITASASAINSTQEKMRAWEKEVKELEKEEADKGGVEDLFKKIYADSSEEVRKAMNKSFQESNGTVLSTNWKEVSSSVVEMKPPESSEFKKY